MIAGKLSELVTTCSPYLPPDLLSEIQTLQKEEDLSMAFEKLVTWIMIQPGPRPAPIQNIDWKDCLELGVNLGLDEEAEDDPTFWKKFQTFKTELN